MIIGLLLRATGRPADVLQVVRPACGLSRANSTRRSRRSASSGKRRSTTSVGTLEKANELNPADTDTENAADQEPELQLIYTEYQKFLGERLDTFGRLTHVLKSMAAVPNFREATVYVDGVNHFTLARAADDRGPGQSMPAGHRRHAMDPASPLLKHRPDAAGTGDLLQAGSEAIGN